MSEHTTLYTMPSAMDPLYPDDPTGELEHLATELLELSSKLSSSIHDNTRSAIADFLRPMNSYYSNLIEGHETHPIDIDKALRGDYSKEKKKRDLQLEAKAHIEIHREVSEMVKNSVSGIDPTSIDFIKMLHQKFYAHLPESFTKVTSEEGEKKTVVPGEFRIDEVKVGTHIAPDHNHLNEFMKRFHEYYNPKSKSNNSRIKRIISIAASHHRLAWIHPFLDGNGRVVRLFSDALFMKEKIDSCGLWSISRGLARKNDEYKSRLSNADSKRLGDLDGRGNLSDKMLFEFCKFFLETSIDQVSYMSRVLNIDAVVKKLEGLTELLVIKRGIRIESKYVLIDLFLKGSISKTDVMRITNTSDKTAKNITDTLEKLGLLYTKVESGKKAYYFPKFPLSLSPSIFPGLYPSSKETDLMSME